jgi:hypothetical protein
MNPSTEQLRDFAREADGAQMARFVEDAAAVKDAARHFFNDGGNGAWRELQEALMHSDELYEDLFGLAR